MKAMQELMPGESIIYYGDTAHLPYGDKSAELVREYAIGITRFLCKKGVKAIVIACNTASAVALDAVIAEAGGLPVFNVIEPAAREALAHSESRQIGVIGTKTTISSGVYPRTIAGMAPEARVVQKATPLLVPLIEEGWLHNTISREVIEAYMSDTGFFNIDALILGCTHYPLVKDEIAKYFKRNFTHKVEVVDSSLAVAEAIRNALTAANLMNEAGKVEHSYFVSDFSRNFEDGAKLFLRQSVSFQKAEN